MGAIEAQQLELLQLLLDSKCSVNGQFNGMTPLFACCPPGFSEAVPLLLKAKADPNWECVDRPRYESPTDIFSGVQMRGMTALVKVCGSSGGQDGSPPVEFVQQLLAAEANPNYRCVRGGETALKAACRRGNTQCIKALVAAKVAVDEPNEEGLTPLMEAYMTPGGQRLATTLQLCGARCRPPHNDTVSAFPEATMHEWIGWTPKPKKASPRWCM